MTPPDIDFKDLWQQQQATPPTPELIIQKAQKFQRNQLLQLWASNILLLFTVCFIGWIWWFYQPELWTTKLGIVLAILSMVLFMGFHNTLLPLLYKDQTTLSNKEYLLVLQQIEQKKSFLQTQVLVLYFLLLSTGLALYFYEYTLLMPPLWAGVCYGATGLWIAFNWLYLRPRIIKKQQLAMEELQAQLLALQAQWQD